MAALHPTMRVQVVCVAVRHQLLRQAQEHGSKHAFNWLLARVPDCQRLGKRTRPSRRARAHPRCAAPGKRPHAQMPTRLSRLTRKRLVARCCACLVGRRTPTRGPFSSMAHPSGPRALSQELCLGAGRIFDVCVCVCLAAMSAVAALSNPVRGTGPNSKADYWVGGWVHGSVGQWWAGGGRLIVGEGGRGGRREGGRWVVVGLGGRWAGGCVGVWVGVGEGAWVGAGVGGLAGMKRVR